MRTSLPTTKGIYINIEKEVVYLTEIPGRYTDDFEIITSNLQKLLNVKYLSTTSIPIKSAHFAFFSDNAAAYPMGIDGKITCTGFLCGIDIDTDLPRSLDDYEIKYLNLHLPDYLPFKIAPATVIKLKATEGTPLHIDDDKPKTAWTIDDKAVKEFFDKVMSDSSEVPEVMGEPIPADILEPISTKEAIEEALIDKLKSRLSESTFGMFSSTISEEDIKKFKEDALMSAIEILKKKKGD